MGFIWHRDSVDTCRSGLFEWIWCLFDKETVWTHV